MSIENDAKRNAQTEAQASRMGIAAWQLEAARAVGNDLVRDIVNDHRRGVAPPSSPLGPQLLTHTPPPQSTHGWVDAPPLPDTPPGDRYIKAMLDAQDARDRAERIADFVKRGVQSDGK